VSTPPGNPLARFLGSSQDGEGLAYVRGIVVRRLYGKLPDPRDVDQRHVDELASDVAERAFQATSSPPDFDGIRRWLPQLVRSAHADRVRREERDRARIDRAADVFNWADRHAPATDWGAREHLLCKWLGFRLDNPVKRESFRMMFEANVEGRTLEELARKYHKTPNAIEARIRKLRRELGPKVAVMDRQNGNVVLRMRSGDASRRWSKAPRDAWRPVEPVPAARSRPAAVVVATQSASAMTERGSTCRRRHRRGKKA
jgi:DNA-directed RNA polymerase specialized sigma24 family protein